MAASALVFKIKESESQLRKLLKKQPEHLRDRVRLLLVAKKSELALSKQALADKVGIDPNSANKWRKLYLEGGIEKLLVFKRGRKKPGMITPKIHKKIEELLSDPHNAPRGYEELRAWLDKNFLPGIKYHAVNKYIKRKFNAGLKVARKSHIQKDVEAVKAFKKTPGHSKE
jgi:putative transposase